MGRLKNLIAEHIQELSGSEFKIAAYLLRGLDRRREVSTRIAELALATGVSWRQTQSALRSLAQKGILQVESRRNQGTRVRAGGTASEIGSLGQRRPSTGRSKSISAASGESGLAASTRKRQPPVLTPPQSAPAESGPTVILSVPAAPVTPSPIAASPTGDEGQVAKEQRAHGLIRKLLDFRHDIPPADFRILLAAADGEIDRLVNRLQDLLHQKRRFEHVLVLGAVVRSLVLIR